MYEKHGEVLVSQAVFSFGDVGFGETHENQIEHVKQTANKIKIIKHVFFLGRYCYVYIYIYIYVNTI